MSEITNILISADRTKLVIEIDDGDRDLLLFDVDLEDLESIAAVEGNEWIALGGGRSLGHGKSNTPT
jgi:hypothetical protein